MDFEFKPNDVAALTPGGRHVQRASERAWDDVLVVSHRTLSKPSGLFLWTLVGEDEHRLVEERSRDLNRRQHPQRPRRYIN